MEEEKKATMNIVKSDSPCPNAEVPLSKSERQKMEGMTKRIMELANEAEKDEAERKEKSKVDYTNLKFTLVKLVADTRLFPEAKTSEDLIKEVTKLAEFVHKKEYIS